MGTVTVDLSSSDQTVDTSSPGYVAGEDTVISVTAIGDHVLEVDGLDAVVSFDLSTVPAGADPSFSAVNGASVTIDYSDLAQQIPLVSYKINDTSSITVSARGEVVDLTGSPTVDFTGSGAGSFVFDLESFLYADIPAITVTGLGAGDSIGMIGAAFSGFSYDPDTDGDGHVVGHFNFTAMSEAGGVISFNVQDMDLALAQQVQANPQSFLVPLDGGGSAFVDPVCFLAGSLIATPAGPVAIEQLKAGDLVLTHEGEAKPVRWLAKQTVSTRFADPLRVLPIRIQAGALGDSLPQRDLFVSPEHALLVAGLLIQAGALVNGTTITRHAAMPKTFTYYHVELDDHALVLAEGVPAETFVDNVSRRRFDNWQEASERPIAELDRPRAKSWRQVPQGVRTLVAQRAAMLGADGTQAAA